MPAFDIKTCRQQFPSLNTAYQDGEKGPKQQVYFDNAGGSQIPSSVIEAVREYLATTNVQLGGTYPIGKIAQEKYDVGYKAAAQFINAKSNEVVIGGATSQLMHNLSTALKFPAGSELVLSKLDHEANLAPWVRVAKAYNLEIKWWSSEDPLNPKLTAASLKPLLSSKTRLVACTHTSNILGTIHDIRSIADAVHEIKGAMLCVDGVAFAPHRQIDVKELDVDIYAFSWYKVYGPHMSMLYVNERIHSEVESLAHYFNPSDTLSDKLGLAAGSYEMVASIPAIASYFGADPKEAWKSIAQHEEILQKILLDFLNSREDLVVYGETIANSSKRLPVISFKSKNMGSKEMVQKVLELDSRFGFKYGHFYSKRLINEVLGLDDDGIVRVSLVHYNTEEEVQEFIEVLERVLE